MERIAAMPVPIGAKGWPGAAEGRAASGLGGMGWRVLDGDLPFPVLVLREAAVAANLESVARYCEAACAQFAPHGKTTMCPQLFARQLDAGAWALTAATPAHLRVYRHIGVRRVLYANQLVEPGVIGWVAHELESDPGFELLCLVDSVAGVRVLDGELGAAGAPRRVGALIEVGAEGVRGGCRNTREAVDVASAVKDSERLWLAGVEGFEGLLQNVEEVDAFLDRIDRTIVALERRGWLNTGWLVTAGGSAYFDRVTKRFAGYPLVLRSGCYLTHDGGFYARTSPLGGRAADGVARLENAIEVWSAVLSRPEPGLVITGMGKRDAPSDLGLPTPILTCPLGSLSPEPLSATVEALSDQHAHLRIGPGKEPQVGDLVGCAISHPCTALDKWRLIPTADDNYRVTGALHTFF